MKSIACAVALVCAASISTALAQQSPPAGQTFWGPPNPQIDIAYVAPKDPKFQPIYDKLKKRQVLEELQAFLVPLRLPSKLQVKIDQCGNAGVHYKPGGAVVLCYEYVANLEQAAPDVKLTIGGQPFTKDDALIGSFVHYALSETARAVFEVLAIPVWGREEHAADRVAGFLMFQFGEKVAFRTLVGTSWFLSQAAAARTGLPTGDFSFALGGDGDKYAFLKKSLPEGRSQNCRWEYLQLARSFNDTFMPYVDREMMKKVQETDWLASP